jgi:hypothetical protein
MVERSRGFWRRWGRGGTGRHLRGYGAGGGLGRHGNVGSDDGGLGFLVLNCIGGVLAHNNTSSQTLGRGGRFE